MNEIKDKKVNNMFFGRQRRVNFAYKIVYVIVAILVICLVIYLVTRKNEYVDRNVDYAFLANYMYSKGYTCELLNRSGGKCILRKGTNEYSFYRFDDGLQYVLRTENYSLNIKHLGGTDVIEFKTFDNAYIGYRNLEYTCTTKDGILSELDKCVTKNGVELDYKAYIGFINGTFKELDNIMTASGYDKEALVVSYEWVKK